MPHLHFLGSLGRRIDRVPTLRDGLWQLEGALLERVWRALGAGTTRMSFPPAASAWAG